MSCVLFMHTFYVLHVISYLEEQWPREFAKSLGSTIEPKVLNLTRKNSTVKKLQGQKNVCGNIMNIISVC